MTALKFYETNQPYGCFSNFSRHPVELEGRVWLTVEHYFQAAKFTDPADVESVAHASTPFAAAQLGRERHRSLRSDWVSARDAAMLKALRAKFAQHPSIASVLASTAGSRLIEHTANDHYWADGGDGSGQNRLGELLVIVRSELPPWPMPFTLPPWIIHPEIEPSDLFWRMGRGEDLLTQASRFHASLSGDTRVHFDAYFPVPEAWRRSWA